MYIMKYCETNGYTWKKFFFCHCHYNVCVANFPGLFLDFLNYMCCLCYCSARTRWYSLGVSSPCSWARRSLWNGCRPSTLWSLPTTSPRMPPSSYAVLSTHMQSMQVFTYTAFLSAVSCDIILHYDMCSKWLPKCVIKCFSQNLMNFAKQTRTTNSQEVS